MSNKFPAVEPDLPRARTLINNGSLALAKVEKNGMRIDVKRLDTTIKRISQRIAEEEDKLRTTSIYKDWKKHFKSKTNLGSRSQLGVILFDVLDYPCPQEYRTAKTNRPKTTNEILSRFDDPFIDSLLKIEQMKHVRSTFLKPIQREVVEGLLHPSYSLHRARTFRSSCSDPNSQNFPTRDEQIGKVVRKCFIPRKGRSIVETDYSAIEVLNAACYNHDPVLIEYINDPEKDMHRDMAAQIFMTEPENVTKDMRYSAKNQFVFPQFYGSYYQQCARGLWEAIRKYDLNINGIPLKDHLEKNGIKSLGNCDPSDSPKPGTFEYHIKQVEEHFWGRRFKVYDEWRRWWYNGYKQRGWFAMFTGFVAQGVYRRNDVINYPIQGSAFHCLLWSLIMLVLKEIKKYKLKTKIIGQIHDSIIADVPKKEIQDYLEIVNRVKTKDLPKEWDWIIIPLKIEAEVGDGNWYDKREVEI